MENKARKTHHQSKLTVYEKLVGLGLIENGDQIRVLKKDELQPMTEEMENKARKTHHQSKLTVYENIVTEDISVILRHAHKDICWDSDLVLTAVRQNGLVLEVAHRTLRE